MLGGSVLWPEVLQELTGEDQMSGAALLEYYAPLYEWLGKELGEEDVSQTVPIVVGAVLGAAALCALTAYFVKEYKSKQKNKLAEAAEAETHGAEVSHKENKREHGMVQKTSLVVDQPVKRLAIFCRMVISYVRL